MNVGFELMGKQFFFAIFSCLKNMCISFRLKSEIRVMIIDYAQTT